MVIFVKPKTDPSDMSKLPEYFSLQCTSIVGMIGGIIDIEKMHNA